MTPQLEQQFHDELEALEKFRLAYTATFPKVPLRGDDPDVRRLLEALAFFTARTRLAAERNVDESLFRIFRQHFSYLLSPIPAMAMLQASPARSLAEPLLLPAGTAVDLVKSAPLAADEIFRFRTLAPLRLLPLEVTSLSHLPGHGGPARITLGFQTFYERSTSVDSLDLYLDYLNDLGSSVLAFTALRRHVTRASVTWEVHDRRGNVTPSNPVACGLAFGTPSFDAPSDESLGPVFEHPLERLRARLHFPQQDLVLRLTGLVPPANWRAFTVTFDLDDDWPPTLHLSAEYFRLHTVPVVNLTRAMAEPLEEDGTRERHRAVHPNAGEQLVPVAVRGVYRMTKQGLSPLEPSALDPQRPSYEAIVAGKGSARRALVSLNLPGVFEKPETIAVDATWHQPHVAKMRARDLRPRLGTRAVDAELALVGPVVAARESAVDDDREALLRLLAIKGHRVLGADDLHLLLDAMGAAGAVGPTKNAATDEGPFARTLAALATVRVSERPSGRRNRALKHVYEIDFGPLGATELPRLELCAARLFDLLAAWSGEEVVELTVRIPTLKRSFRFPQLAPSSPSSAE